MRALLVQADRSTPTRLCSILDEVGCSTSLAATTAEIRQTWMAQPIPVVVVGDGLATTDIVKIVRTIRDLPRGADSSILLAHSGTVADVPSLLSAGLDDVLDLRSEDETLRARLTLLRARLRRGARSQADDLVRVFERALRESEVRYRALFDQSPVGVFLCDQGLRINDINERLRQITGLPRGRMLGVSLKDLEHPPIPGLQEAVVGETAFYDGPYLHPDGSQLWVTVRYAPLRDADGAVVGGIGVVEDVSERHRAEQRLHVQAAELERVNSILRDRTLALEDALQARTRLYTSMNHELRTPISAIMLYQELLMTGALGGLSPDQQQAVERSHTATRHLLELVCDILDLSKLEAGRVVLHPAEVSLEKLLRDLMGTMAPLAERYGSKLLLDLPREVPRLFTDPQRVRQILLNLISNAAKFGRSRPITVRCLCRDDGGVSIEVRDEGIGIEADDLERIFDDFVQVGSPPETGTGLGLSISRRFARLLDGALDVQSRPGEGSTFRLTLPRAIRHEAAAVVDALG